MERITDRPLIHITEDTGPPLIGHTAFGIRTYGTNIIEIRPLTGCQLRCRHCYVAEGRNSETRVTDYIIDDLNYLLKTVNWVAEHLGKKRLEAHLSAQGEVLLHPQIVEIVMGLSEIRGIDTISMQTNGINFNEQLLADLAEAGLDRINLSLNSLNSEKATWMAGTRKYDLEHVIQIAQCIADSTIDLLLAPVLIPGINEEDISQVVQFARSIGVGGRCPGIGIQKYLIYQMGRRVPNTTPWSWEKFYKILTALERQTGYKPLVLTPKNFGIHPRRPVPNPFRKYEKVTARIMHPGRVKGEFIATARNRTIQVINTQATIRTNVRVQLTRTRGNIFVAKQI
ncbi:MAG: radical SAM protein [Candidatus Hodarchaeota archaeon]